MAKFADSLLCRYLGGLVVLSAWLGAFAEEKSIVVIIPSYNNSEWYEINLCTVLGQKYQNFRVIYIDDASTDGTGFLVENYLLENDHQHKVTLVQNRERMGALANIYAAVWTCEPSEIIAVLDGDDWFFHEHVFETLNHLYSDPNVWMTYGQYIAYPGRDGECAEQIPEQVIKENNYREYYWVATHLRSFYAALFQKINKEDLLYKGKFYPVAWDLAFMFPMLEMAGFHSKFFLYVLYVYNTHNPLNDSKLRRQLQRYLEIRIRNKKRYEPLSVLFSDSGEKSIVVVVNSFNNKEFCVSNLNSILNQKYCNYRVIYIDDASTDGTGSLVSQYLAENDRHHKVTFIQNEKQLGALANIYAALSCCKPSDIVVPVNGDGRFQQDSFFEILNEVYSKSDIWMTYGPSAFSAAELHPISEEVVKQNGYRNLEGDFAKLQSFYAGLFQAIDKKDLLFKGKFYPAGWEWALLFPMLEMTAHHSCFVPDLFYADHLQELHNSSLEALDVGKYFEFQIRAKQRYFPLEKIF